MELRQRPQGVIFIIGIAMQERMMKDKSRDQPCRASTVNPGMNHPGYMVLLILLIFLSAVLPAASAEDMETVIRADVLEYLKSQHLYHLRGNVLIKRGDATLRADSVDYYEDTGLAKASGNVRFEDKDSIMEGEHLTLNIDTKKGTITNAHILFKKDNYHVSAEEIQRTGEKDFLLKNTTFTTCDAPLPEWCFTSKEAEIHVGDSLRARDVRFRIKGVPTLYSPVIWAPINNERKTGFLFPEVGFRSDKGLQWRQPFYIVLSENMDTTLYLDAYTRRGVGEGIEYRYIGRDLGEGQWWLYHLRDNKLKTDFFELTARHTLFNPDSLSGFLDINLVNKKDFFTEYSHRVEKRTNRFLESTGEIYRPLKKGRIYLLGRFWQELEDGKTTGDVAQKIPELGLRLYPKRVGPAYLSLSASYSYFYSENLQRANRFDLYPKIYHTTGDAIQLSQSLGIRETAYSITHSDSYPATVTRESFDYSVTIHSRLLKNYGPLLHVVEPEIGYRFIPQTEELPLLDGTELFDRISILEAGIRNYIYIKGEEVLSLKLSEAYDFHKGDRPFGNIRLEVSLFRPFPLKIDTSYDPDSGDFEQINYSTSLRLFDIGFYISQRYSKRDDILSYTGGVDIPITKKLSIKSGIWYNAKGEGLQDFVVNAVYSSQCWGLTLTYNKRPDDYSLFLILELKGLGSIKVRGI